MGWFDSFFRKKPGGAGEDSPILTRAAELGAQYPFPIFPIPGHDVDNALQRFRADLGSGPGSLVLLGDYESAERLTAMWDEPFDFEKELQRADSIIAEAWFEEQRSQDAEIYASGDHHVIHERGTAPMTRLTIGHDHQGTPHNEVYVGVVPTADSTTIPLHLRFGDWNACPSPAVHTAVARYWRDKYGAEIATVAADVVEFMVSDPPPSDAFALELAWQQYLYCSDIVDQGVGSVATLAKALRKSTRWYFWWD